MLEPESAVNEAPAVVIVTLPVAGLLGRGAREDGVIVHRAAGGSWPHKNVTGWLNPFCAVRTTEKVAVSPWFTVRLPGDPFNENPGLPLGEPTVTIVEPQIDPAQALIVAVPGDIPKTRPLFAESLPMPLLLPESLVVVATTLLEELQITEASVCVLLSLKVPTATSACDVPMIKEGFTGLMPMETKFWGVRVAGL
jgi:hypothetical protein